MKIGKKLMLLIIPALMLFSSCGIFKGGGHCDCPTFGETPTHSPEPGDANHS